MPDDLKVRLKTFVPAPPEATVRSIDQLPAAHNRPFARWNPKTKIRDEGTEPVALTVRETERAAQRELLSVLRLVDAGKVAVSDKTRKPSAATIDAITAVLEGGDYYPFEPPNVCNGISASSGNTASSVKHSRSLSLSRSMLSSMVFATAW
jgi:hypothetical protein